MYIIGLLITGLVVGGLARLAVPGPDPMPIWMTLVIGIVGAIVGGGVGYAIFGRSAAIFLFEVGAATLLVIGYRRFVQGRPVTGPNATRTPGRGFGVRKQRARELENLRDAGVLTDAEYDEKRAQLERGD